jgi:type I restriction enzyme, S subunit
MKKLEFQSYGEAFNGKTPSKAEQRSEGLPILKIRDIDKNGQFRGFFESFVDPDFYKKHSKKRLKTGDTIILNAAHNSDYVGSKNAFITEELNGIIATGEWLIVRVNKANPAYINQFLKSPGGRKSLKNCVKGIHLYPKDVEQIEVPVHRGQDQIRIAHLLGKVEGLIAQRKQHLQQLDDLLKSVFLEMFGDLQISAGEDTLDSCLKIRQGFAFKSTEFVEYGTPIIKIGTVNKGVFDYSTLSYIADGYNKNLQRFEIKPRDLLISLTGTVGKDDYGNTCFVPENSIYPTYLLNQRVGKLICEKNIAHPLFIDAFLKLPNVKSALIKSNRGVRQANLSNSDIYGIRLQIPAFDQQQRYAVIVEKTEGLKHRYLQCLADLEALYSTLSQRAFKGELDLSHVPLLSVQPELDKAVSVEPSQARAELSFVVNLSDADLLLDAMENAEARATLISQWLESYRGHLGGTLFSVQNFLAAVQTRLTELRPDDDFELDVKDYEHIKAWVFKAIAEGTLTQAFDDASNRIEVKATQG